MFTSCYTCAPMGTNLRPIKCCPKKVWAVSCLFGAETEVKAAWSIWCALLLGWHIPNGTHPSVPCLTSPVPISTQRLSSSSLQLVQGSQGRAGNWSNTASLGFAA